MRGRNAAASAAAAKKAFSGSPAPPKSNDRAVKNGGQKSHGPPDRVKACPHAEELAKCEGCVAVITSDVAALQCSVIAVRTLRHGSV